jgi:ubiquinone/menaquinone biosynthesis C-methylase UbiE
MSEEPGKHSTLKTSVSGKGVFPHEAAWTLLNPLRALVLSPSKLLARLQLAETMTVLEIGPGPGYFSPAVAGAVSQGKLLLFDIQQEMLDKAAGRLRKAHRNNFETHCGDAGKLPFADASVDVAFMVTVLGEVQAREACLAEIHRVLRPCGLLSISEMRGDPDRLDAELVERITTAAGFEHERTFEGFLHYTLNTRKPGA